LSLQGTLDTFSLAEVLVLIEKARKTGAIEVRDPASRGVLYIAGGRFSGAEAGDLCGPVESPEELDARLIDVCFSLFRLESGAFEFEGDRFPPWPVRGGSEITPIIEQVQQLRRDWLAIESVIPSLDCCPTLVADLGDDRLIVDRAAWRVMLAVDGQRSVRGLARELGRSVLEICRVIKQLVDAGAVEIAREPVPTVADELILPPEPAAHPAGRVVDDPAEAVPVGIVPPAELVDAAAAASVTTPAEPRVTAQEPAPGPAPASRAPAPQAPAVDRPAARAAPAPAAPPAPRPAPRAEPAPAPRPAPRAAPNRAPEPAPAPAAKTRRRPPEPPQRSRKAEEEPEENGASAAEPAPDRGALLRLFSGLRDN
jgi:hypothetical protein